MNILPGPAPELQAQAVEILLDAFWLKVEHLELFNPSREIARRVYAGSLDFDLARFAVEGERVLGVAGLDYGGGHFLRLRWAALRREFGWPGTLGRWFFSRLSTLQPVGRNSMRIAVIATAVEARGSGVGTALIEETCEFARLQGCTSLKLEVVDTNPRAKALYERLGFRTVYRLHTGFITRRGGFTGFDGMEKKL
jgi:ribosomal protein S18 acetylase RimI-like enzyme